LSRPALAILAFAALVSSAFWLAVRGARLAEIELLPAHSLRRVRWWQGKARYVQLACAALGLAAASMQISETIG
jgi:hypothetical protein